MTEHMIQAAILLDAGSDPTTRLFRNNTGTAWQGEVESRAPDRLIFRHPRPVSFGLCVGSSDLIGWRSVIVTPAMVGQRVAVFVGLEVKTPAGRPTQPQQAFHAKLSRDGGLSGFPRSAEEARAVLGLVARR